MPVAQVRIARSSKNLDATVAFYRDGVGLPVLGGFEGHDGYDGVMFGLPAPDLHLEITHHADVPPSTPGKEDLVVMYYDDAKERDSVVRRLASLGFGEVPLENPYWIGKAVTVRDPDGFHVVLFAGTWKPAPSAVPSRWRRP